MQVTATETASKVLIADDDPIARELLCRAVERSGYEAISVGEGLQAWELIKTGQYRLVVSDWRMPGLDGLELCRRIRNANLAAYVYFVLVTGRTGSEAIVEGLSAGADDFLTKPVGIAELRVRLKAGERVLELESRNMVIFSMAKLAESRDPETGAHIERIQSYSRILAEEVVRRSDNTDSVPADFAALVGETSPLHDIGKIGIPDAVLLKPGRYNDEEFDIMRTHTVIGGKTLNAALKLHPQDRFLQVARDIALYHHERYDGTGYPEGLKEDTIPLAARVVALADVYDALTSKRLYKEKFTHLVSRNIILEGKGTHFDPVMVEIFIDLEAQFSEVLKRFGIEATGK